MASRYHIKLEIEYDCPAGDGTPEDTFYRHFKQRGNVYNVNLKIVDVKKQNIAPVPDPEMKRHNEARRVLQTILDQMDVRYKIVKGWCKREHSEFRLHLKEEPATIEKMYPGAYTFAQITVKGAVIQVGYQNEYNLADPTVIPHLIQAMKCAWLSCSHQNKWECKQ